MSKDVAETRGEASEAGKASQVRQQKAVMTYLLSKTLCDPFERSLFEAAVFRHALDDERKIALEVSSRRERASHRLPILADTVAKVFLRHGTQILRAVGATIE